MSRKAAPASALGLICVYINLLTAGWKNNLAERERMESRVESKQGIERERERVQSDPPRFRPIAFFVFP